jgi:beta-1,4-N-acetylglucosaminyltransferase
MQFVLFRYKNSISEEMAHADLIIGHAGAGTCMEVLELGKPFVAVINNALMDDHQSDLAGQLAKDGHLLCTIPENLHKTLRDPSLFSPAPFPKSDPTIFSQFMKNLLGV